MATHPLGAGPPRGGGPGESTPPPSHDGSVVLDIGDGIGALVIYVEPGRDGQEIEVSPCAGGPRAHGAVRRRDLSAGPVYAALLPALPAGSYDVFDPQRPGQPPVATVTVPSARVAELHWDVQLTEAREPDRSALATGRARGRRRARGEIASPTVRAAFDRRVPG